MRTENRSCWISPREFEFVGSIRGHPLQSRPACQPTPRTCSSFGDPARTPPNGTWDRMASETRHLNYIFRQQHQIRPTLVHPTLYLIHRTSNWQWDLPKNSQHSGCGICRLHAPCQRKWFQILALSRYEINYARDAKHTKEQWNERIPKEYQGF